MTNSDPCAPHHRIILPVVVDLQFPLIGVVDAGGQQGLGRSLKPAVVERTGRPGSTIGPAQFLQPALVGDIVDTKLHGV